MLKKVAVILLILGVSGSASAHERDVLATFEGGIGVIPVANGAGPANPDGTAAASTRSPIHSMRSDTTSRWSRILKRCCSRPMT